MRELTALAVVWAVILWLYLLADISNTAARVIAVVALCVFVTIMRRWQS